MRLILACLLYNFDLELMPGQEDWIKNQECYVLWEKPPLMVKLTSVHPDKPKASLPST